MDPCTFHLTGTVIVNGLFNAAPNSRSADIACKMYDNMRSKPWCAGSIHARISSFPRSDSSGRQECLTRIVLHLQASQEDVTDDIVALSRFMNIGSEALEEEKSSLSVSVDSEYVMTIRLTLFRSISFQKSMTGKRVEFAIQR